MKINQVKEELEECVRSLDLDRAKDLKEELQALEAESTDINMDVTSSEEVSVVKVSVITMFNLGYS